MRARHRRPVQAARGRLRVRAALAILVAVGSSLGMVNPQASAATERPFERVFATQANGAITITGNTLETCASGPACDRAHDGTSSSGNNNSFDMGPLDADADAGTTSSSAATVHVPAGGRVLFAGLFWGAATVAGDRGANAAGDPGTLRLRAPGGGYQDVSADRVDRLSSSRARDYSAFADVTSVVSAAGAGQYWAADIAAATGRDRYAGWSLVVAYEDSNAPLRDLTVFSGYASVTNRETVRTTISGFLSPPQGAVNATFGAVSYEGDEDITGDYLAVNNTRLADSQNPSANFFGSRITDQGANLADRTPAYLNNLGPDAKVVDAPGVIPNGATSADLTFATAGDWYYPAALTAQIDLYAPTIRGTKSVRNLSGGKPTKVGDTLEYSMTYSNVGNDNAIKAVASDVLPLNTTYVPGTLKVAAGANPGARTDATGDDQAEYDAPSRTVRFRVGTGATKTDGGALGIDASSTVSFRVKVDAAAAGTTVENTGRLDYTAQTLGKSFVYRTPPVSTPVSQSADVSITKTAPTGPVRPGTSVTYTLTTANVGPSVATDVTVVDSLPSGVSYASATPSQGSCSTQDRTVTCLLGAVASGAGATVAVVVSVPPDSSLTEIVNVADVSTSTSDPNLANNHASVGSAVARAADLSVTKSAAPENPVPGTAVTWTVVARNGGPSTAHNVVVTDVVPSSFGDVSAKATGGTCTVDSGAVSCTIASVDPGASFTVTVTGTLDPAYAGGTLTNRADVQSDTPDPDPANNEATSSLTPAAPSADLVVTKTVLTSPVVAGLPVSYRLTVQNAGPSDAVAVVLTDEVPKELDGARANPGTGSCSGAPAVTCELGDLSAGSSVSVIVNATVLAGTTGTVTNAASATSKTADPDSKNDRAEVTSPVEERADLSLTKSTGAKTVVDGEDVTYTLTVVNRGPSDARSVVVTDPVPDPLTFVSAKPSQGDCTESGAVVTCDLGTLTVGQRVSIDVTAATPSKGGADGVRNTATVTSDAKDTVPENNEATATLSTTPQANIVMSKSVSPTTIVAGQPVTYTLTVRNDGPSDAKGITVTDAVPSAVRDVTAVSDVSTSCGSVGNTVTCTRSGLLNGESFVVTISGTVSSATRAGPLTNQASATSNSPDPTQSDNTDEATATIEESADLGITKTGPSTVTAGTEATWTLTVANAGPSDAVGAEVRDTLPPGVTFVRGFGPGGACTIVQGLRPLVSCPVGTLPVKGSQNISLTGLVGSDVPAGTALTNAASVSSATPDPDGSNDRATSASTVAASADLAVAKKVGPTTLTAGADAVYTVTVTNLGPSTARDVVVRDQVPAGLTIVSATAAGATCGISDQLVTCTQSSLVLRSSIVLRLAVTVDPGASGTISNSAVASAATPDPSTGNNQGQVSALVEQSADLEVVKTAATQQPLAGTGLTYTVTVVNHGPSLASTVRLTDDLPSALTLVDVTPEQGTCGGTPPQVDCSLGVIDPGQAVTVLVRASIDPGFTGALSNSADAQSAVPDPDSKNNSATSDVTVTASADIVVEKSISPQSVVPGTAVDFAIVVENSGPSTATGVVVRDAVPAGLAVTDATVDGSPCAIQGQDVTCTIGTLPVGQVSIEIRADMAPGFAGTELSNTAASTSTTPDPDAANNTSTASADVIRQSDLQVVKTMSPAAPVAGQRVTYTLTASNAGPSDAVNPRFIDQLPAGLTDVSVTPPPGASSCEVIAPEDPGTDDNPAAPTVTCEGPLFRAGYTVAGTITATVTPGFVGTLTNQGRISSDTIDPSADNNESTAQGIVQQSADLSVTTSMSPPSPVAGDDVVISIDVTNAGPSVARAVQVTSQLPPSLTGARVTTSVGTCSVDAANLLSCSLGDLDPATTVTITVTARVDPAATGTLTAAAESSSSTADPDLANNVASVAGLITTRAAAPVVSTLAAADDLAATGASPLPYIAWGLVLLVSGTGAVAVSRQRRRTPEGQGR